MALIILLANKHRNNIRSHLSLLDIHARGRAPSCLARMIVPESASRLKHLSQRQRISRSCGGKMLLMSLIAVENSFTFHLQIH